MNLSDAKIGKNYVIQEIEFKQEEKRRILDLGLTKGTKIKVINLQKNGPMIILVRGTYLAIGRKYALGIMCREFES